MKTILGIILIVPLVWICVTILLCNLSWYNNRDEEKYKGWTKDQWDEEYMNVSAIVSGLMVAFWIGIFLLLT